MDKPKTDRGKQLAHSTLDSPEPAHSLPSLHDRPVFEFGPSSDTINWGPTVTEDADLTAVVRWYFDHIYGRLEGPGTTPYYCDPSRVGHFAVKPGPLAAGSPTALFVLFVANSMFQARRDTVIMAQQREMSPADAKRLTSPRMIARSSTATPCAALASADAFDRECSVYKRYGRVDCRHRQGRPCHVKDATVLLNRTGDMGKVPTSAWMHGWKAGRLGRVLGRVHAQEPSPAARAELLVQHFASVHRVGRKLATLFVGSLSTPALAPGLTPWFPEVDGNSLVVVDTNVARAVDILRGPGSARTYNARRAWIIDQAAAIDLRRFHPDVPAFSPRLVQQALYAFSSKSNRTARRDACLERPEECKKCAPAICPFA